MVDRFTVEVTDDDIRLGVPRSPNHCPVSYAVARALDIDELDVWTGYFSIRVKGHGDFWLPDEGRRWVNRFDGGWFLMDPISFEVHRYEDEPSR